MKTVVHVIRNYLTKGEPFVGYQVAASIDGFRSVVVCKRYLPNDYEVSSTYQSALGLGRLSRLNAQLQYALFRRLSSREIAYLVARLSAENPTLLHFHYAVDAGFFLALKRRLGIPAMVSCYGYDTTSFARRYFGYGKAYLRNVFSEVQLFLAMSEDMKRDLINIGCPEDKIIVHYYGVETERFLSPDRVYEKTGPLVILIVASLRLYKGHTFLLRALARIKDQNPDLSFKLRIVGEGPLRDRLENEAVRLNIGDSVTFTGFIPRTSGVLTREFHQADIFALPSATEEDGTKEGIPGTLVEAMSSGLPVVSTYHAGIPSVIKHGTTGFCVPERDVDALYSYLHLLLTDADLRARLGREAAKLATAEYDFRVRLKNLEQLYRELLKEN